MAMAESGSTSTLEWTRPDQVMQLHRMKLKKRALQARLNKTNTNTGEVQRSATNLNEFNCSSSISQRVPQKRKNPFVINELCKKQKDIPGLEISNDNTLFELLNINVQQEKQTVDSSANISLTFANVLSKLDSISQIPDESVSKGAKHIPIDWTLKTKVRIMSPKPFPWNSKLKTSEEASGTTGFVRCLDIGEKETTLDTSLNARFHQCCLIWQHPSLPWLELFPRSAGKVSAILASNVSIANNQCMKDALHREWCNSFRSLFYLLRARQCPYFYMCANTFTVLFRAAGICGLSEIHALLTPTTRGFRQSLKQEDIEYSMPLRKDSRRRSDGGDSDSTTTDVISTMNRENNCEEEDEEEEEETQDAWLKSLGVENSEIKKINNSQTRMILEKESEIDNLKQSLVFVKGVETQALFNFLINCKSAIAVTGALAGVPPTLLAPTAFHGATLKALKVRESIVHVDSDKYYSLELKGPLLPHVLPSLCHLMTSSQLEQYSASCAQLASTTPFSTAKHGTGYMKEVTKEEDRNNVTKVPLNVFGQENLSDCGFNEALLSHFCNPDPARIEVFESFKFFNGLYTWS